jgi:hypothetical protein
MGPDWNGRLNPRIVKSKGQGNDTNALPPSPALLYFNPKIHRGDCILPTLSGFVYLRLGDIVAVRASHVPWKLAKLYVYLENHSNGFLVEIQSATTER